MLHCKLNLISCTTIKHEWFEHLKHITVSENYFISSYVNKVTFYLKSINISRIIWSNQILEINNVLALILFIVWYLNDHATKQWLFSTQYFK